MDLTDRLAFGLLCAVGLWWGESVSMRHGDDLDVSQVQEAPLEPTASMLALQRLILHTASRRETGPGSASPEKKWCRCHAVPQPCCGPDSCMKAGVVEPWCSGVRGGAELVSLVTEVRSRLLGSGRCRIQTLGSAAQFKTGGGL